MSLTANAAQTFRNILGGIENPVRQGVLRTDVRAEARRLFDRGGKSAREVFGLDVGEIRAVKPRTRGGKEAVAHAQRLSDNKVAGHRRERLIERFLKVIFSKKDDFRVYREQYLRTREGVIALDERTHESRRVDFVVYRGDKLVRSIEVTSEGVNKAPQLRKEADIRKAGGAYMLNPASGKLVKVPAALKTKVVRLA